MQIIQKIDDFVNSFKVCILGTLDNNKEVYLSSLPIVKHEDNFYAYISKVAPHYNNIKSHSVAQIIFAEDESIMSNAYMRVRVNYQVNISFCEENESVLTKMQNVQGDIVNALKGMDFELIKLEVISGKAVLGPGQAYFLSGNGIKQDVGK